MTEVTGAFMALTLRGKRVSEPVPAVLELRAKAPGRVEFSNAQTAVLYSGRRGADGIGYFDDHGGLLAAVPYSVGPRLTVTVEPTEDSANEEVAVWEQKKGKK